MGKIILGLYFESLVRLLARKTAFDQRVSKSFNPGCKKKYLTTSSLISKQLGRKLSSLPERERQRLLHGGLELDDISASVSSYARVRRARLPADLTRVNPALIRWRRDGRGVSIRITTHMNGVRVEGINRRSAFNEHEFGTDPRYSLPNSILDVRRCHPHGRNVKVTGVHPQIGVCDLQQP